MEKIYGKSMFHVAIEKSFVNHDDYVKQLSEIASFIRKESYKKYKAIEINEFLEDGLGIVIDIEITEKELIIDGKTHEEIKKFVFDNAFYRENDIYVYFKTMTNEEEEKFDRENEINYNDIYDERQDIIRRELGLPWDY